MLFQTQNPQGGDVYGQKILLDYSANTNPYGTPQGVLDAIAGALGQVHQYPDPYCRELVAAIAAHEGVSNDTILCGNGAADLIYGFCRAEKPASAALTAPTFSEYALGLSGTDCKIQTYFLREEDNFALTEDFLNFLEDHKPQAVFLCSPNNPTGSVIAPELLQKILACTRAHDMRLFLDECFMDLADAGESMKTHLAENPQLTILKAFTKSYGMAGIRLGYCMSADRDLLSRMAAQSQPWNVSTLAQKAGVAALGEKDFLEKTRKTIVRERAWMQDAFQKLGLKSFPSNANYVLFRGPETLHKTLLKQGIAIRDCSNYDGLGPGWYRVAVRLHEQNQQLLAAIGASCGKE